LSLKHRTGLVAFVGVTAWASSCGPSTTETTLVDGSPQCDGLYQAGEGISVDQAFDRDEDGYVDGQNPGCKETFDSSVLDCDDSDVQRNPGKVEVLCNDKDDDCNDDTPDGIDLDNDGYDCDDCNDTDPFKNPGVTEVCWDGIDNNCDGAVDPGCGPNYNGEFVLDEPVVYACSSNLVVIDFVEMDVLWIPPAAALVAAGGGQPGAVNGTINDDGSFDMEDTRQLASGLCTEVYRWVGQFTGPSTFDAELSATYYGNFCSTCVDQVWTVHAERIVDDTY
jgi:Putative metal-binding motif